MKQYEEVIRVMEQNGGYATLGYLNAHVPVRDWKTKTPFASIRRIVQDPRFFFKIRPGLWALKGWEKRIPFEISAQGKTKPTSEDEFDHSYYQGLLVEIGNLKRLATFVPNQDKNRKFLDKPLASLITVTEIFPFTYDYLVRLARTIDVTWFNERKLPNTFIEVEHSTDIYNSLRKFVDLQDFRAEFWIVADGARRREFDSKILSAAYKPIAPNVKFVSYETVSDLHSKTYELALVENRL
jgi:hypothetical protein